MQTAVKRRVSIYLTLALALSGFFWVVSRYPGLLRKAAKGTSQVTQAWAFDLVWKQTPEAGVAERVLGNFLNWCYTNWKGMTYGLLLAAILLALFKHLKDSRAQNPWLRTLLGAGIGAPMGLCANCAAPVGLGLKQGGAGTETALAVMMASPTLNVVCVTMAFSLLPPAFAALKLLGALLILALIPVLTRLSCAAQPEAAPEPLAAPETGRLESWSESFKAVMPELGESLLLMVKSAVPWMLVAGLLGAILFELLPVQWLTTLEPTFLNVLLVALVGTFVPAPMTFDVIFSAKLLEAGAPNAVVMAMLFSLGIFSIYPMLIIGRNFSAKLAVALFCAVWLASSVGAVLIGIL